ncbi:hypothetical protein B0H11DRAFT_1932545 [Mycena galericulata]|nr:hypothetical protein B0H11DRAFT_1932545 [Mycena galericulata]
MSSVENFFKSGSEWLGSLVYPSVATHFVRVAIGNYQPKSCGIPDLGPFPTWTRGELSPELVHRLAYSVDFKGTLAFVKIGGPKVLLVVFFATILAKVLNLAELLSLISPDSVLCLSSELLDPALVSH